MKTIASVAAIAVAAFALSAQAAGVSPIDPSYYVGQPSAVVSGPSTAGQPVDATNPLSPSYRRAIDTGAAGFEGTSKSSATPYRDVANPLNPQYRQRPDAFPG